MGKKTIVLDLEEIKDLYLNNGYSSRDLAVFFNCSKTTILSYLKKKNIVKNTEQSEKERLLKVNYSDTKGV